MRNFVQKKDDSFRYDIDAKFYAKKVISCKNTKLLRMFYERNVAWQDQ